MAIAIRAVCLCLGAAACFWSAAVLPVFIRSVGLEELANRVVSGDSYQMETLVGLKPRLAAVEQAPACRGADMRSAAVIRFRVAEETMLSGERQDIDKDLQALRQSLRQALSCTPSDAFLWFALYWATMNLDGFGSEPMNYLRMSYQLGPNEAWIAARRCPGALAILDVLPPDIQQAAIAEFLVLIRAPLVDTAINILTGPGWHVKDRLLSAIATLPLRTRENLDHQLRARGFEIAIEGVAPPRPKAFL